MNAGTTRFIVAYATYNRNESKDALVCGVFRDCFPSVIEARKAIIRCIQQEAEEAKADGDYDEGKAASEIVDEWIWRDAPEQICEEHNGIESVYNVIAR